MEYRVEASVFKTAPGYCRAVLVRSQRNATQTKNMRSNCDLFGSDWRWCTIVTVTIRLVQVARGVKNASNCPRIEAAMKAVIKSVEEVCCPALKLVARSSGHLRQ
jgi:hypothetical protein